MRKTKIDMKSEIVSSYMHEKAKATEVHYRM